MGQWLRRYRKERREAGMTGGRHDVPDTPIRNANATTVATSTDAELDGITRRGIAAVVDETRREKTDKAYRVKIFEYFEFADHTRPTLDESVRYLVSEPNIRRFVWYNAFREKCARGCGQRKKRKECDQDYLFFMPSEYDALLLVHLEADRQRAAPPDPTPGVSYSDMEHCKSALRSLYDEQVADSVNALAWDHVWTLPLKESMLMVKRRKARVAKANYVDKMDGVTSPYMLVKKVKQIEEAMWADGYSNQTMSSYRARPRKGHLERVKRIVGYLYKTKSAALRFRTHEPDYSDIPNTHYDWSETVTVSLFGNHMAVLYTVPSSPLSKTSLVQVGGMLTTTRVTEWIECFDCESIIAIEWSNRIDTHLTVMDVDLHHRGTNATVLCTQYTISHDRR